VFIWLEISKIGIEHGHSLAAVIYGEILKGIFISDCLFPHFKVETNK